MRDLDYMIATMQAAKEGKQIQVQRLPGPWMDIPTKDSYWNWEDQHYRVKPEPEKFELIHGGHYSVEHDGANLVFDDQFYFLAHKDIDALYQASRKARGIEEPKYIEPSDVLLEKPEGIVQYETAYKAARKEVFRLGYEAQKAALEKQS